jgi:hypothetical protein
VADRLLCHVTFNVEEKKSCQLNSFKSNTKVRMLFIDYSSAFNTVVA